MDTRFPPDRESDLVTFTRNFSQKISNSPSTYSLSASQAAHYATLSDAFILAYGVANDKATRSPMNLTLKDAAKSAMVAELRALARIVQNAPTTTNAIRDELNLPHRGASPSPLPAPGSPYKFAATLAGGGAVAISWKCDNPKNASGTMYQVWRRVGAVGEFQYVGSAGKKAFVDAAIPAGTSQVTYRVQAVRSTRAGEPAEYEVAFGVGSAAASGEALPTMRKAA